MAAPQNTLPPAKRKTDEAFRGTADELLDIVVNPHTNKEDAEYAKDILTGLLEHIVKSKG